MERQFDLEEALKKYPVAQGRTGEAKQFVFYVGGGRVIKGPYKKDSSKLDPLFYRAEKLKKWKAKMFLEPIEKFLSEGKVYVVFPALVDPKNLKTTKHQESFGKKLEYNLVDPKSSPLQKLSKYFEAGDEITDKQYQELLYTLVLLYALGAGDVGLHNIVINIKTKEITIIDFEENRGETSSTRKDQSFYFTRAVGSQYNWQERVQKFYLDLASLLINTKFPEMTEEEKERLKTAIVLLNKYGADWGKSSTPPKETVETGTKKSTPSWSMKTDSGKDFDIVKSGIQKYIRRGMTEKALQAAFEGFNTKEQESMKTNLFNRISIISCEDISPMNINLILAIVKRVEEKDKSPEFLAAAIDLLSKASKSRIMSHLWYVYTNPEGIEKLREIGCFVDTELTELDEEYYSLHKNNAIFDNTGATRQMKKFILAMELRIKEPNYDAFTRMAKFLEEFGKEKITPVRKFFSSKRTNKVSFASILVWKCFSHFVDEDILDILIESYYTHTENRPYVVMAMMIAIHKLEKYIKIDPEDSELTTSIKQWKKSSLLKEYVSGEHPWEEVDNYVVDKHTKAGRKKGMGTKEFVTEGAEVANQDPIFEYPTFYEIYKQKS